MCGDIGEGGLEFNHAKDSYLTNCCDECIIKYKEMKQPYQIRIEPTMLEQLKKVAKENDTSVNHEIRQAIKKRLQGNN